MPSLHRGWIWKIERASYTENASIERHHHECATNDFGCKLNIPLTPTKNGLVFSGVINCIHVHICFDYSMAFTRNGSYIPGPGHTIVTSYKTFNIRLQEMVETNINLI